MPHHTTRLNMGNASLGVAPIPGRSQSVIDVDNMHQVENAIWEDFHVPVLQLAQEVKISVGSVSKIIQDHLQKLSA